MNAGEMALRVEVEQQRCAASRLTAAARLSAVVVLPTPPFWLNTAIRIDAPGALSYVQGAIFPLTFHPLQPWHCGVFACLGHRRRKPPFQFHGP